MQGQADLLQVVDALRPPGRLAGGLDGGQEQGDQDGDDRDDDQQLDQREAARRSRAGREPSRSWGAPLFAGRRDRAAGSWARDDKRRRARGWELRSITRGTHAPATVGPDGRSRGEDRSDTGSGEGRTARGGPRRRGGAEGGGVGQGRRPASGDGERLGPGGDGLMFGPELARGAVEVGPDQLRRAVARVVRARVGTAGDMDGLGAILVRTVVVMDLDDDRRKPIRQREPEMSHPRPVRHSRRTLTPSIRRREHHARAVNPLSMRASAQAFAGASNGVKVNSSPS